MAQQMKRKKTSKQWPQIYAKDSLDRFGDDLCELLLSYLTFEDRFRCECVSKQFRRKIFESVVDITFRDNCQHLCRIDCHFRSNPKKWIQEFGPLVTGISSFKASDKQSLTHCHRLSQLSVESLADVFDTTSGQLLAMNLKAFDVEYNAIENSVQLVSFFAGNQSLNTFAIYCNIRTEEWFHELTDQLSRLTQLRQLRLRLHLPNGENSLSESLRTIGLNCKQLKRLALNLKSNHKVFNGQTLDSLRCYRQLKQLNLTLYDTIAGKVLKPLKLCHRLTHLRLNLRTINAKLFANCAEHWPRLHYLLIFTSDTTRECLSHLSRLPALKKLVLQSRETTQLSDNDFNDLLSRSPKLKSLTINRSIKCYSL
ncbi:unnamed protein product [Medioppia subpectinata]|uniref:F-box domain-containing protein n=1 Tax=Medioppia subpectinata TaxID=1979941 RepID=A0A7R9Q776_9ACAR|nr:unnamed protein product [Medioppia subpectinata]CAG2115270.1 unnamed protein product [Medioppia subpectinata]